MLKLITPNVVYQFWMINERVSIVLEIEGSVIPIDFLLAYRVLRMPA